MRIFAQIEQKRRDVEERERKYEQRQQQHEDAQLEKDRAERTFDKETGRHKTTHLRVFSERAALPLTAITFVDDKVNHLQGVAPLGVRCVLAGWGYNTPREWQIAAGEHFPVATLETAEEILFYS